MRHVNYFSMELGRTIFMTNIFVKLGKLSLALDPVYSQRIYFNISVAFN